MSLSESVAPRSQPSQKPAKVGHRKSRLGCQRCKQRRVKCDEQKPICGNCSRHGAECVYIEVRSKQNTPDAGDSENSQTSRTRRRRSKLLSAVAYRGPPPVGDMFPDSYANSDDPEIPETKARRMLELRLLQNSLINLSQPNSSRGNAEWLKLWQVVMPTLALHHENVLYAIFSLSATHILRKERSNNALYNARQNYLVLALREQRQEVADINEDNVDAVCLTSILIVISSFAMLQERPLQPYHPPLEWLQLGRGAGAVMWKANAAVPGNVGARFQILIDPRPTATDEEAQLSSLPSHFRAVLETFRDRETFDDEIEEAYRKALCCIGSIQEAIDRAEPSYVVGRQIQAFPLVVPTKFTDLISEHRPRALVVLAYFFGTVAQIGNDLWWCSGVEGDHDRTAYREIQALFDFVTPEWKTLMTWPLDCLQRAAR